MTDDYASRSYGEIPVGTGEKPGIVVVDFQLGFTDPQYPLGGAPLVMRAVENTAKLLKVARRLGVPVAVCNTAYLNEREMPYWKITAVRETFLHEPSQHDARSAHLRARPTTCRSPRRARRSSSRPASPTTSPRSGSTR